jgi:hypothetical protein
MSRTVRVLASLILVVVFAVGGGSTYDGLHEPASMYLAGGVLYVSDPYTGIHLFDAPEGSAPVLRRVVPFEGNTGVAVREGVVYANSWKGIYALRIPKSGAVDTLAGPFGAPEYPAWNESSFDRRDGGWGCDGCGAYAPATMAPSGNGGGSSYAVFAVVDTFLYHVDADRGRLVTLSIFEPESPRVLSKTLLGWDVETLHPGGRYLFVGSETGMHILDREGDPASPAYLGRFTHARACDPVVVQDSTAYVTLRGGSICGRAPDELLAVSIADPSHPRLLCREAAPTPYGLAVGGSHLYVGNGEHGLSLFTAARPDSLALVVRWPWAARDFIWSGSMLYVLEPAGVCAYDVSDPRHPLRLGRAA